MHVDKSIETGTYSQILESKQSVFKHLKFSNLRDLILDCTNKMFSIFSGNSKFFG